jgi:D-psicose/D-tagatose/L-ribulose 3-epimerase
MADWQLGLSSFVWTSPFTTADATRFAEFAAMGYGLVEICAEDVHALDAAVIRNAAADAGLSLAVAAVLGPVRSLSSLDQEVRANAAEYVRACVLFAQAIGAKIVSGPMYGIPGGPPVATDEERQERRAIAVDELRQLARFAAEVGVSLAIEPLNRFETDLVNTVAQAVELCRAVGAPNLGLVLDTFHMNIEEKDLAAAVRLAGPHIVAFQASESDRGTVGSGHVDWTGVLTALHETGYRGPVIVESFRHDIPGIARAVSIWRPVAASPEALARDSATFLTGKFQALR